ncbi:hypothetical protein PACTADRAFT_76140 [Pachysolen tannophilus NRRL Y-2460]|uniref:Major facilitator superfamily (MFS) profile domain-containing protein n=1 Tax=Pachysolen tannophilus NRRL Y-2460 TaxID=669874 RepID=A0A1E4TVE2_PACTA|nr:hypothetical protein PACTADRAFT_76140 [Pachysolen tannophilus NRRL Y-2460]
MSCSNSLNKDKNITAVEITENVEDDIDEIILKTKDIAEEEKQVSVFEAVKRYPKEILWSCIFSLGVVMAGYDAQIISSFYALPSFQKHYGIPDGDDSYYITAAWQTALGMGSPIGQIIGTLFCAWPLEWFGRKKTYAAVNAGCIALVFMQFFAPSIQVLCAGEILAGLLWGFCVLIGPTFASEITHTSLRGILEVVNNLAFVIGQFIANGLAAGMQSRTDSYAYKIPFAIQWIWPSIILCTIYFAPESPYWLVRQKKFEEAKESLRKISSKNEKESQIEDRLKLIIETDALEQQIDRTTSHKDVWKGINLKRTEICSMVYCIQIFSGNPLCGGYSTYFFETAGLSSSNSFNLALGSTAIVACTIILFVVAFLDCSPAYDTNSGIRWAQASLFLVWAAVYQGTIGPMTFVIIGEVPSTKLRGKTIAVATALQSVCALVFTVIMPYILEPTEGDLRGKSGFIFGGLSLLSIVWCFYRLPETKGRTFDEIDVMFHRQVPPRKFKNYDLLGIEDNDQYSTKVTEA